MTYSSCPACQVYHLASVRLRDLCVKLDISTDLRRKTWTCFEYSLVHCTELMMNRHLDQLLMCAIYVMAKVRESKHPGIKQNNADVFPCYFALHSLLLVCGTGD